jgi:hypothetical protein
VSDGTWQLSGEVGEREGLLDGRVRVELEGESADGGASAEVALGWRRGRGATTLEAADSYLTLILGAHEVDAVATEGRVVIDGDTSVATVEATFVVEESSSPLAAAGDTLGASFLVGEQDWSGTIARTVLEAS